ncbi:hypothetical protein PPERSA_02677 [Pseudocohnilembus persalinus]|uniref:Uncharacterized protein n=1 Tax=Pseudocohnilembus persalinus TaxID=266149 RepID=A0A0V0R5M7_PSEPJ|nr:hypothetical protein PPERSA_02677 [Pseudocohnilembus persalinus]|eukprot:KRX09805.1 hypothetical protein PPERSA_02677 [Pseudocohnilembus persalinus]
MKYMSVQRRISELISQENIGDSNKEDYQQKLKRQQEQTDKNSENNSDNNSDSESSSNSNSSVSSDEKHTPSIQFSQNELNVQQLFGPNDNRYNRNSYVNNIRNQNIMNSNLNTVRSQSINNVGTYIGKQSHYQLKNQISGIQSQFLDKDTDLRQLLQYFNQQQQKSNQLFLDNYNSFTYMPIDMVRNFKIYYKYNNIEFLEKIINFKAEKNLQKYKKSTFLNRKKSFMKNLKSFSSNIAENEQIK